MKMTLRRRRSRMRRSRSRICACTETSRDDNGSSATSNSLSHREGARDGHALLLAAADLHRETGAEFDRQPDFLQEVADPFVDLGSSGTIA